jgi:hypothetical protein
LALHDDLLEQAKHLASRERRKPRQASLRRSVSAAYYALFHLLVSEGSRLLAPHQPPNLRAQVRRAFSHGDMKAVCRQFGSSNMTRIAAGTRALIDAPLENELRSVASAFVELQEARHGADYDVRVSFNRLDVLGKINMTQQAFADWRRVRGKPNAAAFLAALLLQKHWSRP